jgi:two-component system NtrC family sensor kinase
MMREDGEESDLIDLIDQSAEQASGIFEDFLDFIKEIPVQKRPVDINKITAQVIEQNKGRDGWENIVISTSIPANVSVPGDESKLRRVICNLVNNATDILHDNKIENAEIGISCVVEGKEVVLTISDNGPGIPEEILNSLFEPFVTKDKNNGTGLGLAIVKQYVNAHQGDIFAANNNGAVFTINLPLCDVKTKSTI